MCSRSLDLISIVVQPNNIATSERRDLSGRLTNTTANVKHSHRLIDLDPMGKVVFMARESLEQSLANAKSAEVERLCPGLFVEVGGQVVVALRQVSSQTNDGGKDEYTDLLTSEA